MPYLGALEVAVIVWWFAHLGGFGFQTCLGCLLPMFNYANASSFTVTNISSYFSENSRLGLVPKVHIKDAQDDQVKFVFDLPG